MKIPAAAKRVFKGVIFDVYQWEQDMFDGTTQTFEAMKRPDTAVVLPLADGQVFYSVQEQPGKKPFHALFGGRVEEGENPLAGAKRELLEESGLASDDWRELMVWHAPGKLDWTVYYYLARDCQKVADPQLDGGEKIDVRSCTPEEFLRDIVSRPDFYETELKGSVYSAFNPEKANELLSRIS